MRIEAVDPRHPDALALLEQAAREARALYPELFEPGAPWPTNPPPQPRSVYLVAYGDGMPLGCGALRPIDETTAEVRRMYVAQEARRAGVAKAVLAELERHALALGYSQLKLETGFRQRPAMALYEACGFRRIEAFGPYADDPASVCFAKPLTSSRVAPAAPAPGS
jgi:GNAT superfamily N-acetyltransferase